MRFWSRLMLMVLFAFSIPCLAQAAEDWVEPMKKVHASFKSKPGTFAQFGDSITDTLAYWTPISYSRKNASPEMVKAFDLVGKTMNKDCWRNWKGPAFGNQSGQVASWANKNADVWLKKHNPETALIMFGTNDLNRVKLADYEADLRSLVKKCLDNGTVVILSTIPPRHGADDKVKQFVEVQRKIAGELKVPLLDYHAEVLKRRPEDWDGALPKFSGFKDYDVPTLIARDGVHPSNPAKFNGDFSEEALNSHGYNLRSYLTLMKYAEVIEKVLK